MPKDSVLPSDIGQRVYEAFGMETLKTLSVQQRNTANAMITEIAREEGHEALTKERLEGVKELVTEHLWDSAYNGLV